MPARRSLIISSLVLVVALCGMGRLSWATVDNLKTFKLAYPGKDPKAYSCKACHEGVMGNKDNLNAYGKALKAFNAEQGAKQLTVEEYQAFDAADTDKDGATNAQELEAGADPSDPSSVPPGVQTIQKDDVAPHDTGIKGESGGK